MKKEIMLCIIATVFLLNGCSSTGTAEENRSENLSEAVDLVPQPTEDIVPEHIPITETTFNAKTPYGNTKRYIEFLGMKEYDSLGNGNTMDTPSEGNVFLVLFLKLENRTDIPDYINPYYVTANIDGKEMENTSLLYDPEGYQTVFANMDPQSEAQGFIAWEVPKNWEELRLDFNNWENVDHIDLHATFTREDLKEPEHAGEGKAPK